MAKKHSVIAFVGRNVSVNGKPWFDLGSLNYTAYEARNALIDARQGWFTDSEQYSWKTARRHGWRIVKVKVIEHG